MDGDDAFFAAPPADGDDQGFAFIGDGGEGGDMDAFAAPPGDDMDAFGAPADDAFAAPPADDFGGDFASPPSDDAFAAPPSEEAPIILGAPSEMPPPEEAPLPPTSAMTKFNEEFQVLLNERQQEEDVKKGEMTEAARLFMEQFTKDREAKREAKMAKNREDEQAKLEAIEADLENDNSWQKVAKMVELTHDGAKDGSDVKRMRDVLILLKNEPSRAEAVGA